MYHERDKSMSDIDTFEQFCVDNEFSRQANRIIEQKNNMAFLDAEFNDGEVCSVGIVIMSPDNKELANMYSIIKPIEHDFMPSRLRKLIGLDFNVLVNEGQDFHKVCYDINSLVRQHKVKNIYTWGSDDKNVFELTKKVYLKHNETANASAVFGFFSMFKSIDDAMSSYLVSTSEPISLNSLACICGVVNVCEHNALEDARCLMNCIACVRQGKADQFLVDEYKSYNKKRNKYRRSRRAAATAKLIPQTKDGDFEKMTVPDSIKMLYITDPSVKAYIDDGVELGLLDGRFDEYHKGVIRFDEYMKGGKLL